MQPSITCDYTPVQRLQILGIKPSKLISFISSLLTLLGFGFSQNPACYPTILAVRLLMVDWWWPLNQVNKICITHSSAYSTVQQLLAEISNILVTVWFSDSPVGPVLENAHRPREKVTLATTSPRTTFLFAYHHCRAEIKTKQCNELKKQSHIHFTVVSTRHMLTSFYNILHRVYCFNKQHHRWGGQINNLITLMLYVQKWRPDYIS